MRWIIGDTESGAGATRRVHILVKPTRADITTNLVINTDRRTYMIELRSAEKPYMAAVAWAYPQPPAVAAADRSRDAGRSRRRRSQLPLRHSPATARRGGRSVYDDGRQVFIEFPRGIVQGEMPPLFVIGPEGEAQIVNYRVPATS